MKIQPQDKTPVTQFHVALRTDVQRTIAAMCAYLNSGSGHVISEAIALSVAGDKEFAAYLDSFQWEPRKASETKLVRNRGRAPKSAAA